VSAVSAALVPAAGLFDPTTERILDAAAEQFVLFGIRRSSVDDIARRANLGRMTVYRRFARKEDLVEAAIMRDVRRGVAAIETSIAGLGSLEERALEGFVAMLRVVRGHPLLTRLLETEPETVLPYLTVEGGPVIAFGQAHIATQIEAAISEGATPVMDTDALAELLARLVHSIVLIPAGGLPLNDDRDAREFARRCIAPLLLASPDRPSLQRSAPRTKGSASRG
jgi:AcrR family transcriptional regulator